MSEPGGAASLRRGAVKVMAGSGAAGPGRRGGLDADEPEQHEPRGVEVGGGEQQLREVAALLPARDQRVRAFGGGLGDAEGAVEVALEGLRELGELEQRLADLGAALDDAGHHGLSTTWAAPLLPTPSWRHIVDWRPRNGAGRLPAGSTRSTNRANETRAPAEVPTMRSGTRSADLGDAALPGAARPAAGEGELDLDRFARLVALCGGSHELTQCQVAQGRGTTGAPDE